MSCSLTRRPIRNRGFTLAEILVAMGLAGLAGTLLVSVLIATMSLSSQNVVTNVSSYRARQTLDRLEELVRFAQEEPKLIGSDGVPASGTASAGILAKRALGGPYVFKNASGQPDAEITAGAMSFMVEYSSAAGLAAPQVGDFFLINLSTHPELEVASVTATSGFGSVSRAIVTTRQGIPENAKPGSYTVSASRYHKEAYVFVQDGSQWTLRHYPRVTAGTSFSDTAAFRVVSTGFQKLGGEAFFTSTAGNGTRATWLRAVARCSDHAEYAETVRGRNTLTRMPVQIKLWNYNAPPPQP